MQCANLLRLKTYRQW